MSGPTRYLSDDDRRRFTPVHAVWEITLACDLKCQHCGSRAGKRRPDELTTSECLDLIKQLAQLGTREITLIGGEAYLRKDWLQLIRAIRDAGMACSLQSGGLHLSVERIQQAAAAGLQGLGISVDGLPELHDYLRGVKGSFAAAFAALDCARALGLLTSVNTQITSQVIAQLRELMERFIAVGARNWQVQLTVAMGRAADHPELLLQPYELLEVMPLLADLYREGAARGLLMQPGNNIGYFGPFEALWRGSGDERVYWAGCNAGQNTIGIEADGTIKGCPSLPTVNYAGGTISEQTLKQMWDTAPELTFSRKNRVAQLWGYCRTCYYAQQCQGGCTWTTHSLFGRPGNNPYCHHRALDMARQGLRERIVRVQAAPGKSFDHGRFELVVEAIEEADRALKGRTNKASGRDGGEIWMRSAGADGASLVQIQPLRKETQKAARSTAAEPRVMKLALEICRGCKRHVKAGTRKCPHCGVQIAAHRRRYAKKLRTARKDHARLLKLLQLD